MVMPTRAFSLLFLLLEVASALYATKTNAHVNASRAGAFMITSGITSSTELCMSVENGLLDSAGANLVLVPCAAAIAAGDGRELFSMQPDGQLLSVAGKLCVGLTTGDAEAGTLALEPCGGAGNVFELEGSGQIKFGKDGQTCISQRGNAAGSVNLALDAAASASSSSPNHGPSQAVSTMGSYWASKLGVTGPVEFVVDLGSAATLEAAEITWEFPAKSFSVMVDNAGSWSEVFSTSVNSLYKTRIPLGSSTASKVKITMLESHPIHGVINGHALYGIASLELKTNGLKSVVEDCSTAGKSADCRDKYFLSYVGEYDPSNAHALRSEFPALEAAQTSLAAVTAELADAVSKLDSCGHGGISLAASAKSALKQAGEPSGLDTASARDLLKEARAVIISLRSALL